MNAKEEKYKNVEINTLTPDVDFSFSTILRIGFCFENADDNRRQNLHKDRILEIQTALTNLVPFMVEIDKKTGKVTYRDEYKKSKDYEKTALEEYDKSWVKDKNGKAIFIPSMKMIQAINDFDEYTRIMAMKYKLYMKIDDDRDTNPMTRKPRIKW